MSEDALTARKRLAADGWISRRSESFRHLPPPGATVWLDTKRDSPPRASGPDTGWTLERIDPATPHQVDIRALDAADPAQRRALFAGVPTPGDDDAAPFGWAQRAQCRAGMRVCIEATQPMQTVWLHLCHQPSGQVEAPLLVIELQAGAHCTLVESHAPAPEDSTRAIVQNMLIDMRLGRGATLSHFRIATPQADDRIAHQVHARLDQDARYDQALIASASSYHLQRTVIELNGAQASARCAAVLFAAGSALEQQVRVRHAAARTRSAIDSLALASDAARVVVNAYSRIEPDSADAEVHQRLNGVPTGGQPKIVLRPHLEILHDQVQARHGATWGGLPEDALFYAGQRGLGERSARAMIIEGMANATLARSLACAEVGAPDLITALGIEARVAASTARHLAGTRADSPAGGSKQTIESDHG